MLMRDATCDANAPCVREPVFREREIVCVCERERERERER